MNWKTYTNPLIDFAAMGFVSCDALISDSEIRAALHIPRLCPAIKTALSEHRNLSEKKIQWPFGFNSRSAPVT